MKLDLYSNVLQCRNYPRGYNSVGIAPLYLKVKGSYKSKFGIGQQYASMVARTIFLSKHEYGCTKFVASNPAVPAWTTGFEATKFGLVALSGWLHCNMSKLSVQVLK